jgi:hypothetical protein
VNIGGIELTMVDGVIQWSSGLAVDADGAPRAYAPLESGLVALDYLGNAGHPGSWWALACDGTGQPVIQGADDPAPGYYVSTTALQDKAFPVTSQRRYVDSSAIPYLAVPPELLAAGVKLGDVARVTYQAQWCPCVVADIGPRKKLGEGSIALAAALGINASPRHGGVGRGLQVTLWAGSTRGWYRGRDAVSAQVELAWEAWQIKTGGLMPAAG